MREFTNGDGPEKFLTTQHERDVETGLDYRGARFYDSDVARFLSLDPHANEYQSLSDYSYVAGNPLMFIDPDGKDIVIPSDKDRVVVLEMINSRASGRFGIDKKGQLFVVSEKENYIGKGVLKPKCQDCFGEASYYSEQLIKAIDSDLTIEVSIGQIMLTEESFSLGSDGISIVSDPNGRKIDLDASSGSVATVGGINTNQIVQITGNAQKGIKDTDGRELRDEGGDVLMHEFVGHAIPHIVGTDTGNAVENENKVRVQLDDNILGDPQPLRAPEPNHNE